MTQFKPDIFEARSHPELNPKKDILEELKRLWNSLGMDRRRAFVSFRSINKLGINPSSGYNTPNGIYAYPLSYILDYAKKNKGLSIAPYAGEQPYAWVFLMKEDVAKSKTFWLADYTLKQFQDDLDKLAEIFMKTDKYVGMTRTKELTKHLIVKEFVSQAKVWNEEHMEPGVSNLPGPVMWTTLFYVSQALADKTKPSQLWANLFRRLGYDAVSDNGMGVIYKDEPTQTVFLTKDATEPVEVIENKKREQKIDFGHLKNLLKEVSDGEFFNGGIYSPSEIKIVDIGKVTGNFTVEFVWQQQNWRAVLRSNFVQREPMEHLSCSFLPGNVLDVEFDWNASDAQRLKDSQKSRESVEKYIKKIVNEIAERLRGPFVGSEIERLEESAKHLLRYS